ncbi:MAG TPA: permease [Noviherbaspirillum sp.]
MQRVLTFEQSPALSVPLRFLLTAPLFAVLAALVLLWFGPAAMASRWSPVTLAVTHLLTLGFLAMCMIGSLLQILPVVAGIDIPRIRLVGGVTHALLVAGTLTLVSAFLLSAPVLFKIAIPVLLLAFAWLFLAGLRTIWTGTEKSAMLTAIRLALASLVVTLLLGATAASGFAWPISLPLMQLTDLHAAWGLLGWVGLLVVGIAYQVVPMFQVTPIYPVPVTQWLSRIAFGLLLLWSATLALGPELPWHGMLFTTIAGAYIVFSLTTLYLLSQRKRPKPDATTMFWRTALASLLGCATLWCAGRVYPQADAMPAYPLVIGILFIVGFGYSVINGMLYKIVPFLVWYHLQNQLAGGCAKAPNVKQILPDMAAERQFRAHLLALLLLLAGAIAPEWLSHAGAAAFAVSSGWLWLNLLKAAGIYRSKLAANPVTTQRPS